MQAENGYCFKWIAVYFVQQASRNPENQVMKVIALIPAAGMGKRMGAAINKQYLLLHEKPILAHTIAVFENAPMIDDIYVIVPEPEIPYCREHVVERYGFTKVRRIVNGGAERQHSVLNGLRAVEDSAGRRCGSDP